MAADQLERDAERVREQVDAKRTGKQPPLKKSKRPLPAGNVPGQPSTPNANFDKAFQQAMSEANRSDVDRLREGTPLPAQTHGFRDNSALNSKLAQADAALSGVSPSRGASGLQQEQRNHPGAFRRPGLVPNLAGVAEAAPEPEAPMKEWDPKLMDAISTAHQQADALSTAGHPERGQVTYTDADGNKHTVVSNAPLLRAMQDRRLAQTGTTLADNAKTYQQDRAEKLAKGRAAVTAGAMGNAFDRMLAMRGGNEAGGSPQYDPWMSALGGFMLGGPKLAEAFGSGAADANSRASENASADRRFSQTFNSQQAALAAERAQRDQQHSERMQQGEQQLATIKGQNKAPSEEEIIAGLLAKDPTGAAADAYRKWRSASPGLVPVGGNRDGADFSFSNDPEERAMAALKSGKYDQNAVYNLMEKMHSNMNVLPNHLGERTLSREKTYYPALVDQFIARLPGMDPAVVEQMVRQFYAQRFGNVPDPSLDRYQGK